MKAQVQKTLLSIGLIVKNEEKMIEGCLKSLQPLRDAISCEVIVTDTGSDDRTVEIAEQYADKVLHYEWSDDFSSARNVGVKAAKGEWFLYIDADEWMDSDVSELVAFLKKPPKNAENASIVMRNYTSMTDLHKYQDFMPARLFRHRPHYLFIGAIHEYVPIGGTPAKINTLVHHYGYQNREVQLEKARNRNLPLLLRMLEREPGDLHHLVQLAREYASLGEYDESIKYSYLAIEAARREPTHYFDRSIHHDLYDTFFIAQRWDKLLKEAPEYYNSEEVLAKPCASDLDVYYMLASAHIKFSDYDDAREYALRYFKALDDYNNNRVDRGDLDIVAVIYNTRESIQTMHAICASACHKQQDYEKAVEYSHEFDFEVGGDQLEVMVYTLMESAIALKSFDEIVEMYTQMMRAGDQTSRLETFGRFWDALVVPHPDVRDGIADSFARLNPDDIYGSIIRLETSENRSEPDTKLLQELMEVTPARDGRMSILLGYALKWGADLSTFIRRVSIHDSTSYLRILAGRFPQARQYISDYYMPRQISSDLRDLQWETLLCGEALKALSSHASDNLQLFTRYVQGMGRLTYSLYNPGVLNDELYVMLPENFRFGYFARQAVAAKDKNDIAAYCRLLERAAKESVEYLPFVKAIIDDLHSQIKKEKANLDEAARIRSQVKLLIHNMIAQNQFRQAAQALDAYAKLYPDDDEIASLRMSISNGGMTS